MSEANANALSIWRCKALRAQRFAAMRGWSGDDSLIGVMPFPNQRVAVPVRVVHVYLTALCHHVPPHPARASLPLSYSPQLPALGEGSVCVQLAPCGARKDNRRCLEVAPDRRCLQLPLHNDSAPHLEPSWTLSPWVLQNIREPTVCFLLLATKSSGDRPAVPLRPRFAIVAFRSGLAFSSMTCDPQDDHCQHTCPDCSA